MKENPIHTMDMSLMENDGRTLSLDGVLLVTDNLDSQPGQDLNENSDRFEKRFPLKLSAACMVIVLKGAVRFGVNFQDFVATENNCLVFSEGTIVEKAVFEAGARVIIIAFSQSELNSVNVYNRHNVHNLYALQVVLLQLLPRHLEMLYDVYQMLRTVLSDPSFEVNRAATALSCLSLISNIILQAQDNQPKLMSKTTRNEEIVAHFLQCVADNYRKHRELSFYADKLSLSLKYMSHVVYKQTGRHPSQWIKDYVILDAKTMLRNGGYTVQQVADELNFPNQSFFGKYFKEAVGMSPKKWKSQ